MPQDKTQNLESLLQQLERAPHGQDVSFGDMLEAVGHRSFGPALLLPGLLLNTPISGVPGMASAMGLVTLLVAVQLLMGRDHFWLPRWILRRRVATDAFRKALRLLRRPAKAVDRLLRPRLQFVLHKPALQILALACVGMGFILPLLEAVPFADTAPGLALTAFGLGMIAHDGAFALAAAAFCMLSFGLLAFVAL